MGVWGWIWIWTKLNIRRGPAKGLKGLETRQDSSGEHKDRKFWEILDKHELWKGREGEGIV